MEYSDSFRGLKCDVACVLKKCLSNDLVNVVALQLECVLSDQAKYDNREIGPDEVIRLWNTSPAINNAEITDPTGRNHLNAASYAFKLAVMGLIYKAGPSSKTSFDSELDGLGLDISDIDSYLKDFL